MRADVATELVLELGWQSNVINDAVDTSLSSIIVAKPCGNCQLHKPNSSVVVSTGSKSEREWKSKTKNKTLPADILDVATSISSHDTTHTIALYPQPMLPLHNCHDLV